MKSSRLLFPIRSRSGFALVLILAILVLLLGLVITFLWRARIERGATNAFAAASGTARLADLAVSLVKGQIRDATTQGTAVAWTSQPGMIRTFGSGSPGSFSASGDLLRVFKLYSARELITTGYTAGADAPPAAWQTSGALWTDLNAPVFVTNPDGGSPARVPRFPILDPAALNSVEGFQISPSAAPAGSVLSGGRDVLRVPMPVRWLYVLQDGRLVAPTENTGNVATVSGATAGNPIVGRVAFWTDDETCKININTASEGRPWDTPRADSVEERALADFQPAQNEFQRYPGHPATTSLAPVLFATSSTQTPVLTVAQRDAIYAITPRVVGGGSEGGTRVATGPLQPESDRLYASVDELIFAVDRQPQPAAAGLTRDKLESARFFLTASSEAPETTLFNTPRVAMWPIFDGLAANRVTAYDRLIAFCSTIDGAPYYFQRANARNPTADWVNIRRNRQLLRYLRALSDKPLPGFGTALVSKTPVQDRDQLLVSMMDYIRSTNLYDDNLTPTTYANDSAAQNAVQFTGGRLSGSTTSVGSGHGAVAPLRVPAGLQDSTTYPAEPDETSFMGFGRFHTIGEAGLLFICTGDGSAGTTEDPINNTPADPDAAAKRISNNTATNSTLGGVRLAQTQRRIQAMLFFDFFNPMQGWTQYSLDSSFDVELIGGNFTINGVSLNFPTSASATQDNQTLDNYHPWGGYMGFRKALTSDNWIRYPLISAPVTVEVPPGPDPTMLLRGPTTVRVKIFSKPAHNRGSGNTDLVQTIDLHFPEAAIPIPTLRTRGTVAIGATGTTPMQSWWTFSRDGIGDGSAGRLNWVRGQPSSDFAEYAGNMIWPEDTLRTLVPYHGDLRLVAGSHYVPAGVFQPSSGYFDPTRAAGVLQRPDTPLPQIKNYLTGSARSHYEGGAGFTMPPAAERLVAGAAYAPGSNPKTPAFVTGAGATPVSANSFQLYGDFDNGVANAADGPYVNKPDEGNNARITGALPYFGRSWEQVASGPTFFSPNRQIPGPGMFGSLPTRLVSGNQPHSSAQPQCAWRTLLVRPQPDHPGAAGLPDHLWLDFFWMPVVEPYAISSPFATAGKINMNYQIEPFTYVQRATGLAALLRSETILAIPGSTAAKYKEGGSTPPFASYRSPINTVETLKQFQRRFSEGSVFRSPTEICDIHLIPEGQTLNADGSNADTVMKTFWQNHPLTGDNSRERPYTNLQARLTTKSNTFTVHYWVQTLKKAPGGSASVWDESKDMVTGEMRGSETIERYINPNETGIPDYAAEYSGSSSASPTDLGAFYRWRTVQTRRFAP